MSFNSNGIVSSSLFQELPVLPSGYKYLEYIKSSGTQYINTGIAGGSNIWVDIEFAINTSDQTGWVPYFGWRASPTYSSDYSLWINGSSRYCAWDWGTSSRSISASVSNDTKVFVSTRNGYFYLNSANLGISTYGTATTTPGNLYIFGLNTNGSHEARSGLVSVYGCKLWTGTTLSRFFIPAFRTSDSKPGLYDTVSNTFFVNGGTGEFTYNLLSNTPASVRSDLLTTSELVEY